MISAIDFDDALTAKRSSPSGDKSTSGKAICVNRWEDDGGAVGLVMQPPRRSRKRAQAAQRRAT